MTVEYRVLNPATGELVRTYDTATDAQVETALAEAAAAFASWRETPVEDRAKIVHRVADLHAERIDDLAAIITREMGKTLRDAVDEVDFVVSIYRYYADNGPSLLADEPLPSDDGGDALVRKAPIGPLLGVMPWNYPYYQVARFAGPNLVAGNTVLLKPPPQCPESALAMAALFREAGVPQGVYAGVLATNEQVAAMISDPGCAGSRSLEASAPARRWPPSQGRT